jgi:hypothetical protein
MRDEHAYDERIAMAKRDAYRDVLDGQLAVEDTPRVGAHVAANTGRVSLVHQPFG